MAPSVAIFGMGRFGRALAAILDQRGRLLRIGGRGRAHSGSTLELVADPADFLAGLPAGALIVLSVPDDAIVQVVREFAALPGASGFHFVHSSGSSGSRALAELAEAGAMTGVFHILQSLPPEEADRRIPGSFAAIAGPPELLADLRGLALLIGVTPIELYEHEWVAYHAAAVLASNALIGLLDTSREILIEAGIAAEAAERMMLPLVQGTLENAASLGLPLALTGPVVRGDAGTIRRHLKLLRGDTREAYKAVMRTVVRLAERSGRAPADKLEQIRRLLE